MVIDWDQGDEPSPNNVYAARAFDAVEQGRHLRRQNARLTILQLGLTALVASMGLLAVLATMDTGPLGRNDIVAASACDVLGMSDDDASVYVEENSLDLLVMGSPERDLNLIFADGNGDLVAMHVDNLENWQAAPCEKGPFKSQGQPDRETATTRQ